MSEDIPNFRHQNAQKYKKKNNFRNIYKASSKTVESEKKAREKIPAVSKLPSNWDVYDKVIDDNETLASLDIDFDAAAAAPPSAMKYQLKQDRAFLPEDDANFKPPEFFELDMNLIGLSLATIPFHKIMGIEETQFTVQELKVMHMRALQANASYQSYLATKRTSETVSDLDNIEQSTADTGKIDKHSVNDDNSELEPSYPETAELEAWLDGVLESKA